MEKIVGASIHLFILQEPTEPVLHAKQYYVWGTNPLTLNRLLFLGG